MTAGELIEELRKYGPDSEIQIETEFNGLRYWHGPWRVWFSERVVEGGFDFVVITGVPEN